MAEYSHSRISCFESCPLQYKFKYIDEAEAEIENTAEAFMGSRVHDALEKLYIDLRHEKMLSLKELIAYFDDLWAKNWNKNIKIVKKGYTSENYRKMGEKYLSMYYAHHSPFDEDFVIDTERIVHIDLDGVKLKGYIDRLDCKDGVYVINDYKTTGHLPALGYLENDRQLALYSIAVWEQFPDVKDVILRWHFLAFDKVFSVKKNKEQLISLKKEIISSVKRIEKEKEFLPSKGKQCDWCAYRSICPEWKHLFKIEDKKPSEYLKDDGVKLVNKYASVYYDCRKLSDELERLKEIVQEYAAKKGIKQIFGSDSVLNVGVTTRITFPEKEKLISYLKEIRKYGEVSTLDEKALKEILEAEEWDEEIIKKIQKFVKEVRSESVRIGKKKEENI